MHSSQAKVIQGHRTFGLACILSNLSQLCMTPVSSSSTGLKILLGMMMRSLLWSGIGWLLWGIVKHFRIEYSCWVRSNRYLTKIVDQLYCLVSPGHASSLVWAGDDQEEIEIDEEEADEVDRLYTFEVTKTNEQEENVVTRPGINVRVSLFELHPTNANKVDLSMLFFETSIGGEHPATPVFLSGEKRQAVYTSILIPPKKGVKKIDKVNRVQLRDYLYVLSQYIVIKLTLSRSTHVVDFSQDLDDDAVSFLIENGLKDRFPNACDAWKSRNSENQGNLQESTNEKKAFIDKELEKDKPSLEGTLASEMIRRFVEEYPWVDYPCFSMGQDCDDFKAVLIQNSYSLRKI